MSKEIQTVFVTGVFGQTGRYVTRELVRHNINVVGFDIQTHPNTRIARKLSRECSRIKTPASFSYHWGDLRDKESIEHALEKQTIDAVVHIAFIIPPFSEIRPEFAHAVNVDGTRHLVNAVSIIHPDAKFAFTSSVATFGYRKPEEPPVKPSDEIRPSINHYSTHKLEAEKIVKDSDLDWTILKLSAVMQPEVDLRNESRIYARSIHPKSKLEPVHVEDVAIAIRNALIKEETSGHSYIIAGGEGNQVLYGEYIAVQINCLVRINTDIDTGDIPWHTFEPEPYYLHWYDTTESQKVLQFQNKSIDEYLVEFKKNIPLWQRIMAPMARKRVVKESFGKPEK